MSYRSERRAFSIGILYERRRIGRAIVANAPTDTPLHEWGLDMIKDAEMRAAKQGIDLSAGDLLEQSS